MDYSLPGSSVHGNSPGKNTGVGCHFLLQGIFPTQGLNPGLLHCKQIFFFFFLPFEPPGKPYINVRHIEISKTNIFLTHFFVSNYYLLFNSRSLQMKHHIKDKTLKLQYQSKDEMQYFNPGGEIIQ